MVRRILAPVVLIVVLLGAVVAVAGPTFYGYVKLDASLDSAKTDKGDYAFIVLPYAEGAEDDEFNMTANQTRLGMKLEAPEGEAIAVSGLVEFDFYGGGAENKANPMLRQAYLEMKFKAIDVLAGQAADVMSPLNPTTLNYIVLWKSGNIGYRRPQIRLSKTVDVAEGTKLMAAVSANRSMGRDEDGEDVGQPSFQGRLAFGRKLMGDRSTVVGVSGVYGKEMDADDNEFESTGIAVDATVPLGAKITLTGEYFTGKDLAVYLGGVGQGIAVEPAPPPRSRELEELEIEASGWWGQLTVQPNASVAINVGAGSDDPELPDWAAADMIEMNTTYYGSVIWNVTPSSYIGAEYAMIETEYVGAEDEPTAYEDSRVQLSFGYKF